MSEIKLLPCPFCGGEGIRSGDYRGHKIECEFRKTKCPVNMRTHYGNPTEATEDWNTRYINGPALTQALETADNIKGLSINESIAVKAIVIALREARGE